MDGDGLHQRRAVFTLICSRERAGHGVVVEAVASNGVGHQFNDHLTTVVRRRSVVEGMLVTALCRVVRRDRQFRRRRVLNGDGLRQRGVVAAFVDRRERARHNVAVRASEGRVHLHGDHRIAAVVCGRSFVKRMRVIALGCVILRD